MMLVAPDEPEPGFSWHYDRQSQSLVFILGNIERDGSAANGPILLRQCQCHCRTCIHSLWPLWFLAVHRVTQLGTERMTLVSFNPHPHQAYLVTFPSKILFLPLTFPSYEGGTVACDAGLPRLLLSQANCHCYGPIIAMFTNSLITNFPGTEQSRNSRLLGFCSFISSMHLRHAASSD